MKKRTVIHIIIGIVALAILIGCRIVFPSNGYYLSLEECEKNNKNSLADAQLVTKCEAEDFIYEVWSNDLDELYVMQIHNKNVLGIDQYRIKQSYAYSMEKALNYYKETNKLKWTNCPEIDVFKEPIFSWCLITNNEDTLQNLSYNHVIINYNNEQCVLLYNID